ncbi:MULTISPECIES: McrC family protein [Streptomyces]|uniref:McrC family protein n=1 Tax=Streptomyces TaxID=1883 RepID=UPI00039C7482|nr:MULTISPECIES: restriction endonuclease [Streptomyces]MBZ6114590.1 McrC family protein [Streptomyces olivaceus]MBZ6128421.1 McrC family protein [Streptomyces olivaceus]MBZ6149295.1 McrC family protein [Streptomyces olivaceus]MBZ6163185.1 McrC family protein [Streptomyces olivaceus]MBZ6190989.1 McrC family protein [Streptomyces olivaceus]
MTAAGDGARAEAEPATAEVLSSVELVEYVAAADLALPDGVGQALAAGDVVDAAPDPYTPGRWTVRAGSKVGAVNIAVPGMREPFTLRVRPKVPIARLFFLLGYSLDPTGGWRDREVDVAEHRDVVPALAHAVERQVDRALRQGLLQGYRAAEESSLVVRGRIREAEQIRRRFGAMLPVEVAYDEFTTDIAENRILRTAVERLLRLAGVPREVRRRLLYQRARLAEVTPTVRGQPMPGWQPTRLNARYQSALRLAEVLLGGASVEHAPGGLRVDGFLFDMNQLFEDFVTVALREALRGSGQLARLQDSHHLDEASAIRMRPDFVLYGPDGTPCAVADAKYKAEKRGGYPDADLYQMLAYCTALGLGEGHLVYAKGNASHAAHRVRHAGILIHQHALDLDQGSTGLLEDIAEVARRMRAG